MAETQNYKLYLTPADDTTTTVLDLVQQLMGTGENSNMSKIDTIIAALEESKANKVVESESEPTGLSCGDEWDRLL